MIIAELCCHANRPMAHSKNGSCVDNLNIKSHTFFGLIEITSKRLWIGGKIIVIVIASELKICIRSDAY